MAFEDLYQEIILDHYRHPRNFAALDEVGDENIHENPTCGDSVKLDLRVAADGIIESVRFNGRGCAISVASASMMTEQLTGLTVKDALAKISAFIRILRGEGDAAELEQWGDLAALEGVVKYPIRVKCATLAWHAASDLLVKRAAGG